MKIRLRSSAEKLPFGLRAWIRFFIVCVAAMALLTSRAAEPATEAAPPANAGEAGGNVEAPNFRDTPGGALVPSIFRSTGASLPSVRTLGHYGEPLYLNGGVGSVGATLPHFNLNAPLRRGFEPEQAQLKLGPIYIRFASASSSVLFSDNVNLTQTNRESGVVAIAQLNAIIIAQLTEDLQFSLAGSLIYLPLENKGGLSGFALPLPLSLGLGATPALQTQISYETRLLGWPVIFADDFEVASGSYSNSTSDDSVLFDGTNFDEKSNAGRYSFGGTGGAISRSSSHNSSNVRGDFIFFSNVVSAATTRELPSDVRFNARVLHQNLWYNNSGRGLPGLRDAATARLQWDRVNLRFKPFVQYSAGRTNETPGIDQTAEAGVSGPITDQLDLRASIGQFFPSGGRSSSTIWNVILNHQAGPYTTESIAYSRTVSYFDQNYDEYLSYYLRQVLGPTLYSDAHASYGTSTGIFITGQDTITRAGVRLTYAPSPRTQFRVGVSYANVVGGGENTTTWTGRGEVSRYLSDTVNLHLLYRYQNRTSNQFNNNYFENLVLLTLTKSFR